MDEKSLAKRLQDVRKQKGLTQQALCQQANLSYSTLAKIERGAIKAPSIFTVHNITVALGISLDELMGGAPAQTGQDKPHRSKSGVTFVYFDVNDTLIRATQRGFTMLAEQSGARPDLIENLFWHHNDALNRGQMSLSDFDTLLAERTGVMVDWHSIYLAAAESIEPTRQLLEWAATYYRVGLMTNSLPGLIAGLRERGILPDLPYAAVVDSSQTGVVKPQPEAFQRAAELAGVPAEEILLIDDSRANVVAAELQGWHVVRFDGFRADESAERAKLALELAD
jgi:FMN phosphatase YigB (HAD superfamily)/DNA-binding XRE family transcriptional regulator